MSATLELLQDLVARPSLTPDDAGCQQMIAARLAAVGFRVQHLRFGAVDNLWACYGQGRPCLAFLGHTDVVPTGPVERWDSPPFTPTVRDGLLYGRGTADMKGGVAAMVTACERYAQAHPNPTGMLALMLTSDEEGIAVDGVVRVVQWLQARGEVIDYCLVGEPSSETRVGDVLKNGRRGTCGGTLVIHGKQGHVAYPHLADNPVHRAAPALAELAATTWDEGNAHFPPTTFQISNIQAGTGASNVIPGELTVQFNFRYGTANSAELLKQRLETLLQQHGLRYSLTWSVGGVPFITETGRLLEVTRALVREHLQLEPRLSTAGGTSDGRFIRPTGAEVLELGPLNRTIHQRNECVSVADLDALTVIYERLAEQLLVPPAG